MRYLGIMAAVLAMGLFAACEQPKDEETDTSGEPGAVMEQDVMEETISVPPTVSEDAPSEPHKGEPPSPSQPQPVVPGDAAMDAGEPAAMVEEDAMVETISVPPTVSEDAPSEPHMGEPPSPNQPQPVVPDDTAMDDSSASLIIESGAMEETISVPPTVSSDAPSEPHKGEPPSPSQPQPVYPDGAPE